MLSFKSFLKESPQIQSNIRKDVEDSAAAHRKHLSNKDHIHIKDDYYYNKHSNGDTSYFRKENNKIKELSVINKDHEQKLIDKGKGGDSNHIHEFMKHHAEVNGHISSDAINTKGSKNLWKNLIKNKPKNKSFSYTNTYTGEDHPLDHTNIDHKESTIWGEHLKHSKYKLKMKHND